MNVQFVSKSLLPSPVSFAEMQKNPGVYCLFTNGLPNYQADFRFLSTGEVVLFVAKAWIKRVTGAEEWGDKLFCKSNEELRISY